MRFWLVSVVFIFLSAQFILWIKDFFIPLPLYIFGGAFLAIASNYQEGIVKLINSKTNNLFNNPLEKNDE
jgi:hypothetical protein